MAGDRSAACRKLLRHHCHTVLPRTAAAPTALASEQLTADPAQQPGGFSQHPAALDAATHTAALFAAADDYSAPAVTRVPAALDAFRSGTAAEHSQSQHSTGWCVGSLQAMSPWRTVITSFGLAPDDAIAAAGAQLCGLQAKVMGAAPTDARLAAEAPLQYCIEWQAQQADERINLNDPAGSTPHGGVHWVTKGSEAAASNIYRMPKATGSASRPAHDAAQSLALLQTAVREAAPSSALQLVTRGALSFPDVLETPGTLRALYSLFNHWLADPRSRPLCELGTSMSVRARSSRSMVV